MKIFRASSLERLLKCPSSGALAQIESNPGEASSAGTAGHRFLELVLKGCGTPSALKEVPEEHHEMCKRIDLDAVGILNSFDCGVEVSFHYDAGTRTATDVKPFDPEPNNSVTGTADRVCFDPEAEQLTVTDWKFGRPEYTTPARHNYQLRFYALAAMLASQVTIERVVVQLGFVDQDTGSVSYDRYEPTLDELTGLMDLIEEALKMRKQAQERMKLGITPDVVEGSHCHFCPAHNHCPAKVSLIHQFSQGLVLQHKGDITSEKVGAAYIKVQTIKKAISDFEKQLGHWVRTNGDVPLPNGRTLGMRTRMGAELIDAATAEDVVQNQLGLPLEIAEKKVTKASILRAVKNAELPNSKAKELIEEIRKAGGITRRKDSEYMGVK